MRPIGPTVGKAINSCPGRISRFHGDPQERTAEVLAIIRDGGHTTRERLPLTRLGTFYAGLVKSDQAHDGLACPSAPSPESFVARDDNPDEPHRPRGLVRGGVAAANRRREVRMAVTEILTLLAFVLAVLCFLAWRWNYPN